MKTALLGLCLLVACSSPRSTNVVTRPAPFQDEATAKPVEDETLGRVVLIGASLTAGFGLDTPFEEVVDVMIDADHEPLQAKSNILFYLAPVNEGRAQIDFALASKPTLLVAVDFLFWFGYGITNAEGKYLATEEERFALLELGLQLLGKVEGPIVVGDFPDMSDAVGTNMLHPQQVPRAATLVKLNARLEQWAKERGDVYVLPLSRIIRDMRAGEPFELGGTRWPADSAHRVIQDDQLHPTIEGMAGVVSEIAHTLVSDGRTSLDDWELDLELVLDEFGEVFEPAD